MRIVIVIIAFALIGSAALAIAQLCPPSDPGYVRQPRPQGEPTNYPPAGEPVCLWYTTSGQQP